MAVSEMNDAGHDVHFYADGRAFARNVTTGQVTEFERKKGIFEMEVEVPRETDRKKSFPRQPKA